VYAAAMGRSVPRRRAATRGRCSYFALIVVDYVDRHIVVSVA
jgi:hypothetical protein